MLNSYRFNKDQHITGIKTKRGKKPQLSSLSNFSGSSAAYLIIESSTNFVPGGFLGGQKANRKHVWKNKQANKWYIKNHAATWKIIGSTLPFETYAPIMIQIDSTSHGLWQNILYDNRYQSIPKMALKQGPIWISRN